jgi:hypothetical protein
MQNDEDHHPTRSRSTRASRQWRAPAPLRRDLAEQQRVLRRVELAWRILDELARELAA